MRNVMRRFPLFVTLSAGLLALASVPLLFASDPGAKQQTARQETKRSVSTGDPSAGERKFKQNCSRCHTAPEGFSPRISGTILRHMRVRASLSAQDERDILHFLNP